MIVNVRSKSFGMRPILKGLKLDLSEGHIHVLCGPSGIGKTTLLKILSGLDDQYDGDILPMPKKIGFVFQEPRLLPWLSVRDNINLVLPEPSDQCEGLLDEIGLRDVADQLAATLSLGMARRVSLARALIVEPDLLIMDEPFVSLDPERAQHLRRLTYNLIHQHGLKAVVVTHDPLEAIEIADSIHVLNGQPASLVKSLKIKLSQEKRFCSASVQAYYQQNSDAFAFS